MEHLLSDDDEYTCDWFECDSHISNILEACSCFRLSLLKEEDSDAALSVQSWIKLVNKFAIQVFDIIV